MARAIEAAIENQPHCESVTVEMKDGRIRDRVNKGYTELTGTLMDVEVAVEREGVEVLSRMAEDETGYPLMDLADVRED
jgi:hypothetical protein